MPADDRDAKFERALEQHLRAGSLTAGCPDAETLAAYHERSLSLEEMAHWKRHIAGCAQCQETLSLVEVTEKQLTEDWEEQPIPVLGAAAGSEAAVQTRAAKTDAPAAIEMTIPAARAAKQRPALVRWAIPLGAVAAGVLIWIGIHEQRLLQQSPTASSVQVAENRQEPGPAPSVNYDVAPKTGPPVARDQEQAIRKEQAVPSAPARVPAEKESRSARVVAPSVAGALQKDDIAAKKRNAPEPPALRSGNVGGAAAPPPRPAVVVSKPQPPAAATETVEVTAAAPSVQTDGKTVDLPAAGAGSSGALEQKHTAAMNKAKSAPQQYAEDANTNAMMLSQGVNRAMVQASTAGSGVIVTPDHKVWWKIGANGSVELTTDAGKNWKTLGTGVTAQLTTGSAPSSKVCWIAGQDGVLLLTTDRGGHWKSVTTPITGNLGGVHAVDAKHATIWDTANRLSYETSDGGATWKQVANE
jgi:Photosynthesis system II assembly factor YCF48